MPRKYTKKTQREFHSDVLKTAVQQVLNGTLSRRQAAVTYGITKSRLCNYVQKAHDVGIDNVDFVPRFNTRQILSEEMEALLQEYLLNCSNMFHGLTPKSLRRLAYEYAIKNQCQLPHAWTETKMASEDWYDGFMRRHPTLSLRRPEATSLARMTAFNPTNVANVFDKLKMVLTKYQFTAGDIFNLDEVSLLKTIFRYIIVGKS